MHGRGEMTNLPKYFIQLSPEEDAITTRNILYYIRIHYYYCHYYYYYYCKPERAAHTNTITTKLAGRISLDTSFYRVKWYKGRYAGPAVINIYGSQCY